MQCIIGNLVVVEKVLLVPLDFCWQSFLKLEILLFTVFDGKNSKFISMHTSFFCGTTLLFIASAEYVTYFITAKSHTSLGFVSVVMKQAVHQHMWHLILFPPLILCCRRHMSSSISICRVYMHFCVWWTP